MLGYKSGSKTKSTKKGTYRTQYHSPHEKSDKAPNVFEFLKFVQKRMFVHPFKNKRKVQNVS